MASGAAAPKEAWGAAALGRLRREQEREAKRARDEVDRAVLGERVSGDDEWERKCAAVRAGMAAAGFSVRRAIVVRGLIDAGRAVRPSDMGVAWRYDELLAEYEMLDCSAPAQRGAPPAKRRRRSQPSNEQTRRGAAAREGGAMAGRSGRHATTAASLLSADLQRHVDEGALSVKQALTMMEIRAFSAVAASTSGDDCGTGTAAGTGAVAAGTKAAPGEPPSSPAPMLPRLTPELVKRDPLFEFAPFAAQSNEEVNMINRMQVIRFAKRRAGEPPSSPAPAEPICNAHVPLHAAARQVPQPHGDHGGCGSNDMSKRRIQDQSTYRFVFDRAEQEFANGTEVVLVTGSWTGQCATVVTGGLGYTGQLYRISLEEQGGREVLVPPSRMQRVRLQSINCLPQFAHKSVEEMRWEHSQQLTEDQRWVAEHLGEEAEAKAPTEARALEWLTPQGPLLPAPAPSEVPSDLLIWARQHLAESIQWIAQFSRDQLDRDKAAR